MATLHIVYGVASPFGGPPVMNAGFGSETVAVPGTSAAIPGGANALIVKAIGGPVWVSLAGDAGANPRIHLADGERFDLYATNGKTITTAAG